MPRIRCIDTETQGFEATDKVCETGWCDLVSDGEGRWIIEGPWSSLHYVDSMPAPARAAHHISAVETHGSEPFEPVRFWTQIIADGVDVVAAHNAEFDGMRWGEPQKPILCTYKAALRLWPDAPSHANGAIRYWLEDQGLLALDPVKAYPPHRAGPDAYVTAHILKALLQVETARQMCAWTKLPRLMPKITFGKHKGPWSAAPGNYLDWVITKSDLDADVKWNAEQELERRRVPA